MSAERILSSQGYTSIGPLGEGTFGSVYACTHPTGAKLAVKVSFGEHNRNTAEREARVMAATPMHPNILPLVSFKNSANFSLLATPIASGGDCLKFMQERSCLPLPDNDARGLFTQLVDAVDHLHRSGFVHRDIKCENVLLTGERRRHVMLADFGFAARAEPDQVLTEAWGSLHYSSPEICARVAYDGTKIDIWSMGVVLFALVTGRLPFGGNTEEETTARIIAGLFSMPHTVSPVLAELIRCMLSVDPKLRISIAEIRKHPWMEIPTAATPGTVSTLIVRSSSEVVINKEVSPEPPKRSNPERRNSSHGPKPPARLGPAGGLLRAIFRTGE